MCKAVYGDFNSNMFLDNVVKQEIAKGDGLSEVNGWHDGRPASFSARVKRRIF